MKGNALSIINIGPDETDKLFSDGEYEMKFIQEKGFVGLKLTEMKDKYTLKLRR
ncbi:MAG TPA: hypothetical protein VIJ95_00190 [Hanamia sp.]